MNGLDSLDLEIVLNYVKEQAKIIILKKKKIKKLISLVIPKALFIKFWYEVFDTQLGITLKEFFPLRRLKR